MLEIKNLSCGYETKSVLKKINFEVKHGELMGIIGPNGSGKTTLLKAITRVLKFKQGEIILQGKSIDKMGFKELAREVAVVSQDCRAGIMTVEEFVLLGRIPYYAKLQFMETQKDKEITEKYMRLTDTFKLKNQLVTQISQGEKQLVFIARALAQEPKLLLLDEPIAHLDITHQVGILDLIRKLTRELGLTVIVVLHNLNLASEYSDRLIMINYGKICKVGTPQEVLTYSLIEKVYKTVVVVEKNPFSLKPHILIVSEEERRKNTVQRQKKKQKSIVDSPQSIDNRQRINAKERLINEATTNKKITIDSCFRRNDKHKKTKTKKQIKTNTKDERLKTKDERQAQRHQGTETTVISY